MPSRSGTLCKEETERENQLHLEGDFSKYTMCCRVLLNFLPPSLSNKLIFLREEDSSGSISSTVAVESRKYMTWCENVSLLVCLMADVSGCILTYSDLLVVVLNYQITTKQITICTMMLKQEFYCFCSYTVFGRVQTHLNIFIKQPLMSTSWTWKRFFFER